MRAVLKFKLQRENNNPPSDATKELMDMEPLFSLLLRRFHVPANYIEEFQITNRNGGMS